ncbi:GNAT family N-acetyltransferase [Tamlana fucoidanivorans]|uniref:GNAT family N-acetyltransferase n=1 Tax=Allotamlana fucoidanivorans TaxID=2583814 RepID=A0A5C4SQ53_9FLAO|nr:GNAT family protein [Tamlana fucoidanivorans]TNJ46405.1 GNAT family N-acetyltransferase [Tamlana fucoidanivorans]
MTYLENQRVKLITLNLSNYLQVSKIAMQKDLVQFSPSKIDSPEDFKSYVEQAIADGSNNTAIPFLIYDKQANAYAGSTRFGNMHWKNKVLHIGWTWIGKQFQGTGLNIHVKFLMLEHAFETLNFDKVEFRVDERNSRSRKAVEKLGATLEGILRKDTLMPDSFRRNTCCYGILKEEWLVAKTHILKHLHSK